MLTWIILVALLVLAGLGALAALIVGIVLLCRRRFAAAGILGGVMLLMLLLVVFSAVGLIGKAAYTGVSSFLEHVSRQDRAFQARVEKLKSYVDPSVLPDVPEDFFTREGFRDCWRVPLVYPYAITCIDILEHGSLGRDDDLPPGWAKLESFDDITHLAFDGRFLLLRQAQKADDFARPSDYLYYLCEFRTGKYDRFDSRRELFEAAKKRGYTGELRLMSVEGAFKEYFRGSHDTSQDLR